MENAITYPTPEELLPHSHPMVLIDEIIDIQEKTLDSKVTISPNTQFLTNDKVPSYVAIEYIAQSIGALAGFVGKSKNQEPKLGFLLGSKKMICHVDQFTLNQELRINVTHLWGDESLMQFEGSVTDLNTKEVLVEAHVNVFSPEDADEFLRTIS